MKDWVHENFVRLLDESPDWFDVEKIPDAFLPVDVLEAEGGVQKRRRSTVIPSVKEIMNLESSEEKVDRRRASLNLLQGGSGNESGGSERALPTLLSEIRREIVGRSDTTIKQNWKLLAEEVFKMRVS